MIQLIDYLFDIWYSLFFSYFHPDIDRHITECLLLQQNVEVGTYLIRNSSDKDDNCFVVSVRLVLLIVIILDISTPNEPRREKTCFLHMRKQRRRSVSW